MQRFVWALRAVLMNINEAFPSKYLKAHELKDQTPTVTIDRVVLEQVRGRKGIDTKPVVYFRGEAKGMLLNKTMAQSVTQIARSPMTETWAGVAITLYATTALFGTDTHEVIRIKAPAAATVGPRGRVPLALAQPADAVQHPAGYLAWLDALRNAAMHGTPSLEADYRRAPKAFRVHLQQHGIGLLDTLKAIAARTVAATSTPTGAAS